MPLCTVCGEDAEKVTKCNMCGAKFCSDCGDHDDKTCIYCYEEEDEDWDTDIDDLEDWDDDDEWNH